MTEIPEHLLNRSKARRAAASGEAPAQAPATTSTSTPATSSSATPERKPAVPVAPVVQPDPPYVAAAKARRKVPFWAMAALSLLPLWTFMYLLALSPEEETAEGPMSVGAEIYGACAGCHGANGAGGAGQVLYEGASLKTFPHIEDMLNFVYTGSQPYVAAGLKVYGDPNREGGPHQPLGYNGNAMPQQGETYGGGLTEYEILGVVCYIRYELSGADPASEEWAAEYANWCSPDSPVFAALEAGSTSFNSIDADFTMLDPAPNKVGTEARATTAD